MRWPLVCLWLAGCLLIIGCGRFEGKWPEFVTWATQKGFTAVAIPIVRWAMDSATEPTTYLDVTFADGTKLSGLGYPVSQAYPLKMLIVEAHEKGLRFYADLSQLGRIASADQLGMKSLKGRPLDTDRAVQVAEAILDLGADGIIGRYFPPDWADAVAAAARKAGAVYISTRPGSPGRILRGAESPGARDVAPGDRPR